MQLFEDFQIFKDSKERFENTLFIFNKYKKLVKFGIFFGHKKDFYNLRKTFGVSR